jgi:hypothetical protein
VLNIVIKNTHGNPIITFIARKIAGIMPAIHQTNCAATSDSSSALVNDAATS